MLDGSSLVCPQLGHTGELSGDAAVAGGPGGVYLQGDADADSGTTLGRVEIRGARCDIEHRCG